MEFVLCRLSADENIGPIQLSESMDTGEHGAAHGFPPFGAILGPNVPNGFAKPSRQRLSRFFPVWPTNLQQQWADVDAARRPELSVMRARAAAASCAPPASRATLAASAATALAARLASEAEGLDSRSALRL